MNQREELAESSLRQRQTQSAVCNGEQQGLGELKQRCRWTKSVTGPGRRPGGAFVHFLPHDAVIPDS